MKVKLNKIAGFDGVEYSELDLELDELTGKDLISATKEAKALGDQASVVEFSKIYQAVVAAKAAKVPVDLVLQLKARDFTEITLRVQNFLIGGGSAVTPTTPSE